MHELRRKLVLSIFMLFVTVVTLSSTTFAWFVKNREAWTDEFDLDIDSTEGLLISTDGVNFSQDVSLEDLKKAIENKTGFDYTKINYNGVTLKHTDKKISYDADNHPIFQKDAVERIGDTDYYNHIMVDADSSEYIAFDLWLKVVTTGEQHPEYSLRFQETSYIKSEAVEVELQNTLKTAEKEYVSGDKIIVNPADAMRLGVVYTQTEKTNMKVFEPNLGLGSSAIEGKTNQDNDKSLNAMYTYYNKTHPFSQFTVAASDGEGLNTEKKFENTVFGDFSYSNEAKDYNAIKLTVFVWLEGWDADYFMGVPASKIKVKLGFTIDNKE